MTEWQPIETAPKDGTVIQARIPGHGENNMIAWVGGIVGENDEEAETWAFVEDQEPPPCWTDGYCWDSNEDEVPSVKPTHWMPLPEPLK